MSAPPSKKFEIPVWKQPNGSPLSCREKIKILNENLEEIRDMAQDALEDGILMGCDEAQLRAVFTDLVDSLENPYRNVPTKGRGTDGPGTAEED